METGTPKDTNQHHGGDGGTTVSEGTGGRTRYFAWWKIAVVVMLGAAVGATLALKHATSETSENNAERAPKRAAASGIDEQARRAEGDTEKSGKDGLDGPDALATVNGEPITRDEFVSTLRKLPGYYRGGGPAFKKKLLDTLIEREILLQEADSQGIEGPSIKKGSTCCGPSPGWKRDTARIQALVRQEALSDTEVTEQEMREYFEEHRDSYGENRTFEELKSRLKRRVRRQKEKKAADQYVSRLKNEATVERAEDPFGVKDKGPKPQNPLDRALEKDVPVVADFGRGECTPCKMMKPILEDLKEKYEGQAEVLIIDTGDYPDLARRCEIRAIPTQIFFDASGQEVERHSGFMPREDLVEKLSELGVE
ncbi:MAG: thioredoxin domain-containing protein [Planctomycetota bacterium]